MPYSVVVDLSYLADGAEVALPGFMVVKNKEETYVSDEEANAYEQAYGISHEPAYAVETDENGNVVLDSNGDPVMLPDPVGMSQIRKSFSELMENFSGVSVEDLSDSEDVTPVAPSVTPMPQLSSPSGLDLSETDSQGEEVNSND